MNAASITKCFAGIAAGLFLIYSSPSLAQVVAGEEHCVVRVAADDPLNIRSKPNVGGKIVSMLRYGECGVTVTGPCKGSWCPIEDGHFSGWVNQKYLSMVSPPLYCVTGVAKGDRLNLRAFPFAQSRVLRRLSPNQCDIAFLPYDKGTWQKVRIDGLEGWVSRRYLSGE